ncbi:MAG TPA: hypothetical protein VIW67_07540 [Terriglobales bacterium]|jgi:hypothetical protein
MPTEISIALQLQVDSGNVLTPDELDRVTRSLRHDLSEQDVQSVEFSRDAKVPAGAKSAEAVALGSLAVAVLPVAIPKVIEFLRDWLMRGENRTLKLKLQVGGNSAEIEYNPGSVSTNEIEALAGKLTGALGKTG